MRVPLASKRARPSAPRLRSRSVRIYTQLAGASRRLPSPLRLCTLQQRAPPEATNSAVIEPSLRDVSTAAPGRIRPPPPQASSTQRPWRSGSRQQLSSSTSDDDAVASRSRLAATAATAVSRKAMQPKRRGAARAMMPMLLGNGSVIGTMGPSSIHAKSMPHAST